MIYFEVQNNSGKILAGNMHEFSMRSEFENSKIFSDVKNGKRLKGAFESIDDIRIWVVVEDDSDLLRSAKLFKKTFNLYKVISLGVWEHHKSQLNAHKHTLETIQGQIRQKIDTFADSQKFYGDTYSDSVDNISALIEVDKRSASDVICYIHKRIIDMRAHLLGVEIIHSNGLYEIKPSLVSLKRAILNQCTPFINELEENKVKLKFYFDDDCEIEIDKNIFSLIMYNFFSNAVKYTKFDSELRLNYSEEERSLDISMISLKMDRDELNDLRREGARGKHTKNIPGNGIGLFVISRALELMGKTPMYISPAYEKSISYNGNNYVENHFKFEL